jgi:hypothetical protein
MRDDQKTRDDEDRAIDRERRREWHREEEGDYYREEEARSKRKTRNCPDCMGGGGNCPGCDGSGVIPIPPYQETEDDE